MIMAKPAQSGDAKLRVLKQDSRAAEQANGVLFDVLLNRRAPIFD